MGTTTTPAPVKTEVIDGPALVKQDRGMMEVATTRAAQEVQAAMVIAKKYPRDETAAILRITNACKRKPLAEQSQYAYPRGNTTINGPSIRIAEVCAQNWGNVAFGIVELEQREGGSDIMAYAWDLETNTRQDKVFTVKHERHTRSGSYKLTDPRDIYEMTANQGARRLRACILGIIPGDITELAIKECDKTLAGDNKEPIIDRARKMVEAFGEYGVNQEMIEQRLGHKIDTIIETELVNLRKIYATIRDNMATKEQFFPTVSGYGSGTQALTDKLKGKKNPKAKKKDPAPVKSNEKDEIPYIEFSEVGGQQKGVIFKTAGKVKNVIENTVALWMGPHEKSFKFAGEQPEWLAKDKAIVVQKCEVTKAATSNSPPELLIHDWTG